MWKATITVLEGAAGAEAAVTADLTGKNVHAEPFVFCNESFFLRPPNYPRRRMGGFGGGAGGGEVHDENSVFELRSFVYIRSKLPSDGRWMRLKNDF